MGSINLYAITHHYPKKLLKPFEGTPFLTTIKKDEIFDLTLSTIGRVRFVILRTTDNPLLALFSNNFPKVAASYQKLSQETDLLEEISIYFAKIIEYYGAEVDNMYTKEDFWRDYPPNDNPFVFPWLKEYHEREIQKIQRTAREAMRKAAQEAARAKEAAQEAARAKEEATQEAARAKEEAAQKAAAEAAEKEVAQKAAAREAAKAEEARKEVARAKEATKRAKLESRIEMAKTLRSMGMELSLIAKATNFSPEEILAFNSENEPKEG